VSGSDCGVMCMYVFIVCTRFCVYLFDSACLSLQEASSAVCALLCFCLCMFVCVHLCACVFTCVQVSGSALTFQSMHLFTRRKRPQVAVCAQRAVCRC